MMAVRSWLGPVSQRLCRVRYVLATYLTLKSLKGYQTFQTICWVESDPVRSSYSLLQDMQGSKLLAEEASSLYERAISGLMKNNMLLYFAYADFEEVTH